MTTATTVETITKLAEKLAGDHALHFVWGEHAGDFCGQPFEVTPMVDLHGDEVRLTMKVNAYATAKASLAALKRFRAALEAELGGDVKATTHRRYGFWRVGFRHMGRFETTAWRCGLKLASKGEVAA